MTTAPTLALAPLPYHRVVADILERENPAAFASLLPRDAAAGDLDQALLRSTYRLERTAHPDVYDAIGRAGAGLGLGVPVEAYADEGRVEAGAELVFVPDRAILVLTGPLLNALDADELTAVVGHELAHHLLWTADGGRHLAAARLLDASESDARTPTAYLETARRHRLATELYADRGAVLACNSLTTAVAGLLKATTGLARVDPEAYLRQAAEVRLETGSAGSTHPETVLRAWALQQWQQLGSGSEETVELALAPELDLAVVDLPGQDRLAVLTRELVGSALSVPALRSEEVTELGQQYGATDPGEPLAAPDLAEARLSSETRQYLAAVLADLGTAHPDEGIEPLAQVVALGRRAGIGSEVLTLLSRELDLSSTARGRLTARADLIGASDG